MAEISFDGVRELEKNLGALVGELDSIQDDMLEEGGKIIAESWKTELERAGHRDTGRLISSVSVHRKQLRTGDKSVEIYPKGNHPTHKDGKGKPMRMAAIAFILHYGRSGHSGSRFVTKAEMAAEAKIEKRITSLIKQKINEKGLN